MRVLSSRRLTIKSSGKSPGRTDLAVVEVVLEAVRTTEVAAHTTVSLQENRSRQTAAAFRDENMLHYKQLMTIRRRDPQRRTGVKKYPGDRGSLMSEQVYEQPSDEV